MHSGQRHWLLCVAPNLFPQTLHTRVSLTLLVPRALRPLATHSGQVTAQRLALATLLPSGGTKV